MTDRGPRDGYDGHDGPVPTSWGAELFGGAPDAGGPSGEEEATTWMG